MEHIGFGLRWWSWIKGCLRYGFGQWISGQRILYCEALDNGPSLLPSLLFIIAMEALQVSYWNHAQKVYIKVYL